MIKILFLILLCYYYDCIEVNVDFFTLLYFNKYMFIFRSIHIISFENKNSSFVIQDIQYFFSSIKLCISEIYFLILCNFWHQIKFIYFIDKFELSSFQVAHLINKKSFFSCRNENKI